MSLESEMLEAMTVANGPRLIDIGRGVVDAREIKAVNALLEGDGAILPSGKTIPHVAYAQSEVLCGLWKIMSPLPSDVIITRWREALGGLPEPIGAASRAGGRMS